MIYFSPIWNGLAPSFQHQAAAVFLCGKGRETCSFPHWKKLLLAGAPGANSPSLAALDRFPFLSLRDIFPRPGEVVLWDGAFGSTEKFPAKVQSLRHARGSLFEGAGKTDRFCLREFPQQPRKNKPSRADKVPERAYKTIFYALAAAQGSAFCFLKVDIHRSIGLTINNTGDNIIRIDPVQLRIMKIIIRSVLRQIFRGQRNCINSFIFRNTP